MFFVSLVAFQNFVDEKPNLKIFALLRCISFEKANMKKQDKESNNRMTLTQALTKIMQAFNSLSPYEAELY